MSHETHLDDCGRDPGDWHASWRGPSPRCRRPATTLTAITASMTRTAITTATAAIAASGTAISTDRAPPPPAYGPPPPPGGAYYRARPLRSRLPSRQRRRRHDLRRPGGRPDRRRGAPWQWRRGGRRRDPGRPVGQCRVARYRLRRPAVAFRVYAEGLNGNLGQRYEWRHGRAYGYFTPMREFRRGGVVCREFTETSYRPDGRSFTRSGSACRRDDGNWRFD